MTSATKLTTSLMGCAFVWLLPQSGVSEPERQSVKVDQNQLSKSGKYLPNKPKEESKGEVQKDGETTSQKPVVKSLGGGRYQIGKVILDKKNRAVHVPAEVNMTEGVVEYILVADSGKLHESVFSTSAKPADIHVACLLLGMKELPVAQWPKSYLQADKTSQVAVEIVWKSNGPLKRLPATECVLRTDSERLDSGGVGGLASGHWVYSGSNVRGGAFAASSEGSVISIIADDAALVNGLRPRNQDDTLYAANAKVLPNKNFKVEVVFKLPAKN
ncbi:hypothetical protein SAMN02745181_0009 [Rubritalea squalenifaciens DSM 18772]|uniref:Uncharacterized protein n=1 Tax=Rubritalea squalenifaciens DSM 18772 TaxID=1123071 RepID=A0A1M6SX25_9BACT|nr:YdjY domain-containing protein [Rubritalea squalenifaciens]SHK49271.1 hypothetical protein SAMN02745181_0009 [Rubritalea squalenifaciens DSM 18772]